ncbi:MAG: LLM class flavin-dependent oxidoreductase [Polyangiaceae bacterium]|jgi:natural product biosynthesis luciferase-like monooxygenase protein|nr:LLM class flavin-dependent oxidoreductase [Polyangiaceae bacterium]
MYDRDDDVNQHLHALLSWPAVGRAAAPRAASAGGRAERRRGEHGPLRFSFMFFSDANQGNADKYRLVFEVADFGDRNGFQAIWLPERHFHPFGGIYPDPAVLAAALAARTRTIRLRSGSVVLPLHHPTAVVESWAMVDNLSRGRVDMGFASGWNPNDFVAAPENYARRRELWHEGIPLVKKLWRGEPLTLKNGKGEATEVRVYPRPIQEELDVWLVVTKSDDSFRHAGEHGYNVLTMLQGIDLPALGRKIRIYGEGRRAGGLDPDAGEVTLMLHTFVHRDRERVERAVREPFLHYIRSALTGHLEGMAGEGRPAAEELSRVVEYSYRRYFETAALFGTVEDAAAVAQAARAQGVSEIACLMDFGVDHDLVRESLPYLERLKGLFYQTAAAEGGRDGDERRLG